LSDNWGRVYIEMIRGFYIQEGSLSRSCGLPGATVLPVYSLRSSFLRFENQQPKNKSEGGC